jgi:outer membrane receptor protein involved in Fe transport
MKRFYFSLLVLLSVLLVKAQDQTGATFNIQGKVVDEQNKSVPSANIALIDQKDSSIQVTKASERTGAFTITAKPGDYFLKITLISFQEKVVPKINVRDKDIDLGTISMSAKAKVLNEVVVTSEKSQMKLELDKRIYTVGKDMSNVGGTASDVLNNVPSVTVDIEGNVSLRGSGNVRILIDGKVSALTSTADALRQLPANLIESIEVITNPSSRYEAAGEAGIINIILKKNNRTGLNGIFTLNAGYPSAYGASFNINYRKKSLNFFTTYGIDYRSTPGRGTSFQQFNNADTSFAYQQIRKITRSGTSHNLIAGVDYFVNERNSFTGSFLYNPSNGINKSNIVYDDLDKFGNLQQTVLRNEREDEQDKDMEASLSYRKKFAAKDHLLIADFKYVWGDEIELSDYWQGTAGSGNPLLQIADNRANEHTVFFQSDYVHPFGEEAKLETGVRTSTRTIKNNYLLEQQSGGSEWEILPAFNNNMVYTEKIHAAYVMGSKKIKRWALQGGLRAELSDITTELTKTGEINPRSYFNLFPSASASYELNEDNTLQLSYSYRINRPQYRDLLPYSNFSDLRSFFKGNPDLNPEFTHSFDGGHLVKWIKGTFLSNVYYRYSTGGIQRYTEVDSSGVSNILPINLATQNAYGLEFNLSLNLNNWWVVNSNLNLFRAVTNGDYKGRDLYSDAFTGTSRISSRMTFFKKWDFQTAFNYRAPRATPQGKDLSTYFIDMGISGDVLKGKGTVTFNARDIFNSRKRRTLVEESDYYLKSDFQWRSRQLMLTFSYRLNRIKEKAPERNNGAEDSDNF